MASSGKKKTTMAKLNRERKLRERRLDKQARKDARKAAAAQGPDESGDESMASGQYIASGAGHPDLEPGNPDLDPSAE